MWGIYIKHLRTIHYISTNTDAQTKKIGGRKLESFREEAYDLKFCTWGLEKSREVNKEKKTATQLQGCSGVGKPGIFFFFFWMQNGLTRKSPIGGQRNPLSEGHVWSKILNLNLTTGQCEGDCCQTLTVRKMDKNLEFYCEPNLQGHKKNGWDNTESVLDPSRII